MFKEKIYINNIPAIVWGKPTNKAYIFVHGKKANKKSAIKFATVAAAKGYQTISFDLPQHGERDHEAYECNIWHGVTDLNKIADYVFAKWENVALFGCSLGAFFSLYAYGDRQLENCLFQSPILDMNYLMQQMFKWFNISEAMLEEKGKILTPIDTMSWDYYMYVKENPIKKWPVATSILYGAKDDLQSLEVIEKFANQFGSKIRVAENSLHPFMAETDIPILESWFDDSI